MDIITHTNFENICTAITITRDNLDSLRMAIYDSIQSNFVNKLKELGLTRKCPDVSFREGSGNNIDIYTIVRNTQNQTVKERFVGSIPYTYDTTNIYLNYSGPSNSSRSERVDRFTVLMLFTVTSTISGFSIITPSYLSRNADNTYSINVNSPNSTYNLTFKQTDNFISFEDIINNAYNPDNIDFDNIQIRNKLLSNPNCYYELSYTDLIHNNEIKNIPYIVDSFYDILDIPKEILGVEQPLYQYSICSVLSTTKINYSIKDYPVLFPKTIITKDNTIKGYINYVYDIPVQQVDTGDSINDLYTGQLINLEDSQYVITDANTVVQMEDLGILCTSVNTVYDGKFHKFNILYPNIDGVKIFTTLTSSSHPVPDNKLLFRSAIEPNIHSWYLYNSDDSNYIVEDASVDTGNYEYLYKVCLPFTKYDINKIYHKEEYLRLHEDCIIDGNRSRTVNTSPMLSSYTTQPSAIYTNNMKLIVNFIEIESPPINDTTHDFDFTDFIVQPKLTGGELTNSFFTEVDINNTNAEYKSISYNNIGLGTIYFKNDSSTNNGVTTYFGAYITFYRPSGLNSKDNLIFYNLGDDKFFTISDKIYISYDYVPNVYLEYYGYTNVYIDTASLCGYYINTDTQVSYERNKKFALDYYFATGKYSYYDIQGQTQQYVDVNIINDIELYFAEDVSGEPGEWVLVNSNKYGNQYSLEPNEVTWGYPDENNLEHFQNESLTKTIWYKLECPNFDTIIDKGTLTINDIPIRTEDDEGNIVEETNSGSNDNSSEDYVRVSADDPGALVVKLQDDPGFDSSTNIAYELVVHYIPDIQIGEYVKSNLPRTQN